MTKRKPKPQPIDPDDEFISDKTVIKEFDITKMTLWRWDRSAELDFPPAIYIERRKYRSRKMVEAFKQRLLRKAIADSVNARQLETAA